MSLIGKIQIINTLIVPHLVYSMQSLPAPGKEFFHKCESLIRQFIWDNKKAKISMCRLQQEYDKGGLRLVDLQIKDQS